MQIGKQWLVCWLTFLSGQCYNNSVMSNNPSPTSGRDQPGVGASSPGLSQSSSQQVDYSKPVAYDNQGRPLYAHPPDAGGVVASAADGGATGGAGAGVLGVIPGPNVDGEPSYQHQYVHLSHPFEPEQPDIPSEVLKRYEESKRRYPRLNLSRGEFIISDVKRHFFGVFQIWLIVLLLIAAMAGILAPMVAGGQVSDQTLLLAATGLGLLAFLIFGGGLIATYLYQSNRFFLTNESVIQEIQVGIFSKHEQTISLENVEDASYYQRGLLPYIFNYGTIRLSTQSDEQTYKLTYVPDPKKEIALLNNVVEAYKNGRPVIPELGES